MSRLPQTSRFRVNDDELKNLDMLITDRAEIEKHVHTDIWDKIVSKYQELCTILIEIPAGELKRWVDSYSEEITKICEDALVSFQERADILAKNAIRSVPMIAPRAVAMNTEGQ